MYVSEYIIFNKKIIFDTNMLNISNDIEVTFFIYKNENSLEFEDTFNISLISIRDKKEYCITTSKNKECIYHDEFYLYPRVIELIRDYLFSDDNYFAVHSAALLREKSLLLIANGNGGKSTSAFYMFTKGYHVFSDDTSFINLKTGMLNDYALAFGLREKTIELLPELKKHVYRSSFEGKWLLRMIPSWVAKEHKIDSVILLELDFNSQEVVLQPVLFEEGLYTVLAHSFNFKTMKDKISKVNRLKEIMKDTKTYVLRGSNLSKMYKLLDNLSSGEQ